MKNEISKYEELLKKYNRKIEPNLVSKNDNYMIIDDTKLGFDKSMRFNALKGSKIVDIKLDLFEKIEIVLSLNENDHIFIKLTLEDLSFFKNSCEEDDVELLMYFGIQHNLKLNGVEFYELDFCSKFRLKFEFNLEVDTLAKKYKKILKHLDMKMKNLFIEIESKYLSIEYLENFKKENTEIILDEFKNLEEEKFINSLMQNMNIGRKKVNSLKRYEEASFFDYSFLNVYRGILLDKKGDFDIDYINKLYLSEDLKFLLTKMYLIGSVVISCGKTNIENEFYIVLHLNETYNMHSKYIKEVLYGLNNYETDKRTCHNEIVLIKFKEISFLNGDDIIGKSIGYNYVEVNNNKLVDFRIGTDKAKFLTVHANDVEIDILDDCKRYFEWPTYWNNLGNK
ncbi:hypothetical protein [Intestinibacter sp.]